MKRCVVVAVALAAVGLFAYSVAAQTQEPLRPATIVRILQSAMPDLDAAEVDVSMIKHLTRRTKVNLSISERNAVLYLSWQRGPEGQRWWFEHDADRSLIFLSRTSDSIRAQSSPQARRRQQQAREEQARERSQTIEVDRQIRGEEPQEQQTQQTETETQPAEQPEQTEQTAQEQPRQEPAETEQPEQTEPEQEQPRQEPAETEQPEQTEPEQEQPQQEPAETEQPEQTEQAEAEPGQDQAQPAEEAQTPPDRTDSELDSLPLDEAVGPGATGQQFLSAFVTILLEGDEFAYADFLLRKSEITVDISDYDFEATLNGWRSQCRAVHARLSAAGSLRIEDIVLQKPLSVEIEENTIEQLRQTVPSVEEVYTYAQINLALDQQRIGIYIAGLMRTSHGWRIGGRISIINR